jgi:hypothetical protein
MYNGATSMTGSVPTTMLVFSSAPDEDELELGDVLEEVPPLLDDELLHAAASNATAAPMTTGRATRITFVFIEALLHVA